MVNDDHLAVTAIQTLDDRTPSPAVASTDAASSHETAIQVSKPKPMLQ